MPTPNLAAARMARGWTQVEAASRLGVTQGYLSLLERGLRAPSSRLWKALERAYGLVLGSSARPSDVADIAGELARRLAALGYQPFAYLESRAVADPEWVLRTALASSDLEMRVVEALPWVVLEFPKTNWASVVDWAKRSDVQNRLGYVVALARQVGEGRGSAREAARLRELENGLEPSVLFREVTLCRDSMPKAERDWLLENRPALAKRWRVLTDLRAEHLPYAA
jgi:transcriptional regulator with XRE-family HTH domain